MSSRRGRPRLDWYCLKAGTLVSVTATLAAWPVPGLPAQAVVFAAVVVGGSLAAGFAWRGR